MSLNITLRQAPSAACPIMMRHDVTFPLYVEVDEIYNLACPASPNGVRLLAEEARKAALASVVNAIFAVDLAGRVIPFDRDRPEAFAEIAASRKISGQPISQFDATIATRNHRDFMDCGIDLIDPWGQGE